MNISHKKSPGKTTIRQAAGLVSLDDLGLNGAGTLALSNALGRRIRVEQLRQAA